MPAPLILPSCVRSSSGPCSSGGSSVCALIQRSCVRRSGPGFCVCVQEAAGSPPPPPPPRAPAAGSCGLILPPVQDSQLRALRPVSPPPLSVKWPLLLLLSTASCPTKRLPLPSCPILARHPGGEATSIPTFLAALHGRPGSPGLRPQPGGNPARRRCRRSRIKEEPRGPASVVGRVSNRCPNPGLYGL